ncbi:MAG TPA: MaoC family dehydratase [Candidatus Dormibacteraeota bacterium]|jgi:acyl dehydratase
MLVIEGIDKLPQLVGKELGASDWHEVTQDQVNLFADATGDHQWIHVDVEKAAKGPFGAPIAHGYLTLSLLPVLMTGIARVSNIRMGINYGLNRVRFPSPVKVGSRIRAASTIKEVTDIADGVQVVFTVTVEIEGVEKPACVAEPVVRYLV